MSDEPSTANSAVFEANLAVKMGETIATASQKVNVSRLSASEDNGKQHRQTIERGNIVVDVNQTLEEATLYNAT